MTRVARVVPDVTGIDKHFDYLVPEGVDAGVGDVVRVVLHGRTVRGWIVDFPATAAVADDRLLPLARVGLGPDVGLVDLARWAARRWCGPRRTFLQAASPERIVRGLPTTRRRSERHDASSRSTLRRLGPLVPDDEIVRDELIHGPALVVVPTQVRAMRLVAELRRHGYSVASWPRDWDAAAGGVDAVVGTRSAVWARIAGLASLIVVDEHDEALQGERAPTWHAREVAVERASRDSLRLVLTSPIPTVAAMVAVDECDSPAVLTEAGQWPEVRVVAIDSSVVGNPLVTTALLDALRTDGRRVAVVHNAPGRSVLLVCRGCNEVVRCEACAGGVTQAEDGSLQCRRCEARRPPVCHRCSGQRLGNVRPGIARMREELEAATGVVLAEVTATSDPPPRDVRAYIGTEAVIHRVEGLDEVVILDVDRELYAPRFLAAQRVAALVVTAARAAGAVSIQTRSPDHPLLVALAEGDVGRYVEAERERRGGLGLPPFSAVALLSGRGLDGARELLEGRLGIVVAARDSELVVRATDHETLSAALATVVATRGLTPRIEVDPTTI